MNFTYQFAGVKGIQAGREYYIAMIPLGLLGKLFLQEEDSILPEYRAQRRLNEQRIPQIKRYILDNREDYVFSALAASIDGRFEFHETGNSGVGILEIDMNAKFLINDGQHRKAAILEAIKEDASLEDETISIVLFKDLGLKRSQQMFTDLNKHAVKTSNSIAELFDSRDLIAVATKRVIAQNEFFDEFTDKEKDNLGKYSSCMFTLNTFYLANKKILQKKEVSESDIIFLEKFWNCVEENIDPWNEYKRHELTKKDLRELYVVNQAVIIQAIGLVGNTIYKNEKYDFDVLEKLKKVNWSRRSKLWQHKIINDNGKIVSGEKAISLAADAIKSELGIR